MPIYAIDESQRKAARVAGLMYLFIIITANLVEFYVRRQIIVRGDAMQTARNIAASADLFRLGIAGDVAVLACDIILIIALYVLLKPINRHLALLAVFWRLIGCSMVAATIANSVAALLIVGSLPTLSAEQLPVFTRLLMSLDTGGNRVAALFFGLGSTLFCYLWFKSRFVPRVLAGWGIFASLVPAIVPLSTVLLASLADAPLRRARAGIPIAIFEAAMGLWLLIKGVKQPVVE